MFFKIIQEILSKEPYKTEFKDYTIIHNNNIDIVPKGSHIKYINLNEEIKIAGTLLEIINNKRNSYLLIMGSAPWKLYLKNNFFVVCIILILIASENNQGGLLTI